MSAPPYRCTPRVAYFLPRQSCASTEPLPSTRGPREEHLLKSLPRLPRHEVATHPGRQLLGEILARMLASRSSSLSRVASSLPRRPASIAAVAARQSQQEYHA